MEELIICVAPYPSEKQSERSDDAIDAVEEAVECCAAGASLVHLLVRDERGNQELGISGQIAIPGSRVSQQRIHQYTRPGVYRKNLFD